MKNKTRVCWDSCVIIDLLNGTPDRIADILDVIDEAKKGKVAIIVSAMAIAEIVKIGTGNDHLIDAFFRETFVHVRNVDRFVAGRAASICRDFNLKPPDAIHVATALDMSCKELHTYDGHGLQGTGRGLLTRDGQISGLVIKVPCAITNSTPLIAELLCLYLPVLIGFASDCVFAVTSHPVPTMPPP